MLKFTMNLGPWLLESIYEAASLRIKWKKTD